MATKKSRKKSKRKRSPKQLEKRFVRKSAKRIADATNRKRTFLRRGKEKLLSRLREEGAAPKFIKRIEKSKPAAWMLEYRQKREEPEIQYKIGKQKVYVYAHETKSGKKVAGKWLPKTSFVRSQKAKAYWRRVKNASDALGFSVAEARSIFKSMRDPKVSERVKRDIMEMVKNLVPSDMLKSLFEVEKGNKDVRTKKARSRLSKRSRAGHRNH